MTIQSFKCPDTEAIYDGRQARRFATIRRILERKLQILDAAVTIGDLGSPPGIRLEPLNGDRAGQHSIRVNGQWRLCFVWTGAGPKDVECVDYH